MKNILFIFSGYRDKLMNEIAEGQAPDTQLYGMNHINGDFRISSREFANTAWGKKVGKLIGFRLRNILMYFYTRSADIVFGSSLFYMLPLKKLFGAKGKFIILNIYMNRFLSVNSKHQLIYRMYEYVLKSADLIISLSHVQQDELASKHGVPSEKLKYVALGVDTRFYQPVYEDRKNYILSVGRDNGRDYKTVIEVAKKMPDREFHLVLSKRNIEGIEDIPANVKLFFDISRIELKKKYAEAAVLLLITHKDGYGHGSDCSGQTVLLDAFASGLPVIASRKTYIADYGKDRENLLLVDFYDVSGIIKALNEITAQNGVLGLKLSHNARIAAEREFSTEKMGQRLGDLFKAMIERI